MLHTYTREGGAEGSDRSTPLPVTLDPELPNIAYTRGRVTAAMLAAGLPPSRPAEPAARGGDRVSPAVGGSSSIIRGAESEGARRLRRVVVSGPQGMWESVKLAMEGSGHEECLVELEA